MNARPVNAFIVSSLVVFVAVGSYYRIQSQRSGEKLDRTKEGVLIFSGIRLFGLLTIGSVIGLLWKPSWFAWAVYPIPAFTCWMGVVGVAMSIVWLLWMFHALGRNLTDTVVTRRNSYLVSHGPYRFVRNPMYTGVLLLGLSLGLALGTWLVPLTSCIVFCLFVLRTKREEQFLIERFGDSYRAYRKRVGRFFPKLSGGN